MAAAGATRVRRTAAVLLLAALSIALWAPDLRRVFGHPLGEFGFIPSLNSRIAAVLPGSPAARAGVPVGPFIDYARMPILDRLIVGFDNSALHPGQKIRLAWREDGRRSGVDLVAAPEDPKNAPVVLIRVFLALVFLFAGSLVVLRRPSTATWAFFIFTLAGGAPVNVISNIGPVWLQAVMNVLWEISVAVPAFAGPFFALYLLHEGEISRRRRIASWIIAIVVVFDIFLICSGMATVLAGSAPSVAAIGNTLLVTLAYLAVPFMLGATYLESSAAARERLRWVILGFTVCSIVRIVDILGQNGITALQLSYFGHSVLVAFATFAVCFTVMYAVLKHRIIDVNVAVSRAVVYAVLSAIIVGLFALVDLFFNRALSHSNAGYIADIGLALILGFFFNTMHRNVDHFVDGLLFRSRHLAERHLATVLTAIPYAKTEEHVTELVIKEPVQTLDLSGALLSRVEEMQFTGAASLIAYLEGSRAALRLGEHGAQVNAPMGFEPAVAAPIFSHGDLIAVAFYGFHKNHTDLDQEEVTLLERIASAAGAAYDHLEAQSLRREVEALRAQLATVPAATSHTS